MRQFLLIVCLLVHGAIAVDVEIRYSPPRTLTFTLPVTDVGAVVFHYHIKHMAYLGTGVKTATGWEYTTNKTNLEGAGLVSAYAVVNDMDGESVVVTNHTFLSLDNKRSIRRAPGKSIRGAAFFRDDFDNFNGGNWNYEVSMYGGYNGEFQVYTNDPKNVFTRGGNLYVYPIPTVSDGRFDENFLHTGVMDLTKLFGYCTESALNGCYRDGHNGILPPVMSGKVKSVPLLNFGILEVRAKIPKGDWLWPAIWLLPKDDSYGQWPRSGEIDIMESRGNNGDIGVGTVTTTLHWGPSADQNRFMKTHGEKKAGSWHDDFHTWRLEWTQDHIATFVDNQQIVYVDPGSGGFWAYGGFNGGNIWGSKMAPFDKNFYLMFNVAVGGTSGFFPEGDYYGVRKPWANNSPRAAEDFWNAHNDWLPTWQGDNAALLIDYVEFRYL
ncbi:hypothetical protein BsWGS_22561 [Bradybaena similaris]